MKSLGFVLGTVVISLMLVGAVWGCSGKSNDGMTDVDKKMMEQNPYSGTNAAYDPSKQGPGKRKVNAPPVDPLLGK